MGFFDRILGRVERRTNEPRVDEDGFVHAPDISPDDLAPIGRQGWSGPLPDHGMHATPPYGWKEHIARGFGVIPSQGDGLAGGFDGGSSYDSGGGDSGGGGGDSGG